MSKRKYSFVIKNDNDNPDFGWKKPDTNVPLQRFEEPKVMGAYGLDNKNYNTNQPIQPTQTQIDSVMTERDNADRGIDQPQNDELLRNIARSSYSPSLAQRNLNVAGTINAIYPEQVVESKRSNIPLKDIPLTDQQRKIGMKIPLPRQSDVYADERMRLDAALKAVQGGPITQRVIDTIKAPFQEAQLAGEELRNKQTAAQGTVDLLSSLLHGTMLPFTAPYSGVEQALQQGGTVGKEVATGLNRTMNLPFDLVDYGSRAVHEGLKLVGVDTKKLSQNIGISPELDQKIANLTKEVAGLYLTKKIHDLTKGATNEKAEARQRTKSNGTNAEQGNVGPASQETINAPTELPGQEKVGGENAVQEQITNPQVLRGEQPRVGLPKVDEGNTQPEKVAGKVQEEKAVNLLPRTKKILEKGVEELGNIEEVNKKWSGNKPSDIYARQYAQKIFGEKVNISEPPKVEQSVVDNNVNAVKELTARDVPPEDIAKVLKIPVEDVQKIQESQKIEPPSKMSNVDYATIEKSLKDVPDIKSNPTGWKLFETQRGEKSFSLIDPNTKEYKTFNSYAEAQSYAIDNPIVLKEIPQGEIVTKNLVQPQDSPQGPILKENKPSTDRAIEPTGEPKQTTLEEPLWHQIQNMPEALLNEKPNRGELEFQKKYLADKYANYDPTRHEDFRTNHNEAVKEYRQKHPVSLEDQPTVQGSSVSKEPYKMTKEEWRNTYPSQAAKDIFADKQHKDIVTEAYLEGKGIPENVLNEYPTLKEDAQKIQQNTTEFELKKQKSEYDKLTKQNKLQEEQQKNEQVRADDKTKRLLTTPLSELIEKSGYKSNRQGVHDLIKVDQQKAVEQALKEGKQVPEEVLKDYPDLAEKYKVSDIAEVKKEKGAGAPSKENTPQTPEGKISEYDISKEEDFDKLINDIESSKGGEYFALGLRGLYKDEIGMRTLKASNIWEDGNWTEQRLGGTSTVRVVADWDYASREEIANGLKDAIKEAKKYGNAKTIAIVKGNYLPDEILGDPREAVLGNAKVVGYIKPELSSQSSRTPKEGVQTETALVKETPESLTKENLGQTKTEVKANKFKVVEKPKGLTPPKGSNAVIVTFKDGRQGRLPIKDLDVMGTDLSKIDNITYGKADINKSGGIKWDTFSPLRKQPEKFGFEGSREIPKSMAPEGEPIKASSIIKQLGDELNVPIRVGKEKWGKRIGVFKIQPEVIRTKEANDLAVTSHEVAHLIDKKFLGKSLRQWRGELAGLDYDQSKKRTNEGFAEFMRHYLTMDDAEKIAPKFYKYFTEDFLPKNAELSKTFGKAKESITQWREQGALSRVLSQIDFTGKPQASPIKEKIIEGKLKLQSAITDRLAPLRYAVDQILKNSDVELRPSEDPYKIAASVQKTSFAKAREFVMNGPFDFRLNKVGKSLKEIVKPVSKDINNAIAYTYAKHAESLHKRGINPGISLEDAQYVLKNHLKPEYEQFSKDFTDWSNYVIDYLVDAGGLSKEAATRMREVNPFYIPLKRSFEAGSFTSPRGKGFTDLPSPIKRIKGSGREIINPLESMIAQTEQIISVADKARVARALADLADKVEGAGKWIEKVPAPMEAKIVELENLKKQIENAGGDLSGADLDAMITLFSQGKGYFGKDNIVSIYRNGKREYFQLHPYLYDAMKGLDKVTLPWFLDYTFGKATRMVRLGATGIRAGFSLITNPIRDAQTFMLQSEHAGVRPDKIAKAILEELRGKSEYAREFRRAGGEMAQPLGLDRKMLQNTVNEILADDVKSKTMNIVKHPIEALREVLSFSEAGARLAEFEAVMNKYKSKFEEAKASGDLVELKKLQEDATIEASNADSEVTVNFKRAGSYSAVLNQIIPFFNPAIQGVSRMGRTIWEHPVRSGLRATALMTAPTLALWAINKDEEWYRNLPAWERYAFWHFKVGDTIVRLPKPFEWGYIFAGIPEGVANSIYQENPEYVGEAISEAVKNLSPDFTPALVKPAAEVYFNWDMFRERPIVSRSQEGLLPEQQFTPYTSGLAKEAGQILGVSPSKIDHLLSGYSGGLATDILNALPKEIKEPADILVVGRLFTRESAVGFNGESVKDFYNAYTRTQSIYKTVRNAQNNGRQITLTDEDNKYLAQRNRLSYIAEQLSLLRRKEQLINKMDADSDVKKKLIQSIESAAVKLAEQGIMFLKSPKEQERLRKRKGGR